MVGGEVWAAMGRGRAHGRSIATDDRAALARAHDRLGCLSEISKLLTRFQSVERTLPDVVAVIAKTIPVRNVILVLDVARATRTFIWETKRTDLDAMKVARDHARASYEYLTRTVPVAGSNAASAHKRNSQGHQGMSLTATTPRFVSLPLVVDHGRTFGILQVEAADDGTERDLVFLNAIANQLAIAIARRAEVRARQARVEASEREQRLLAGLGAAMGSSLQYRRALSTLARFATKSLSAICIIDEVTDDGELERVEVRFADKTKQRTLASDIRHASPRFGGRTLQARVLRTGQAVFVDSADERTLGISGRAELGSEIAAIIAVPLRARDRTMGVLTLGSTRSSRWRLSARDLPVVEEIARRSALFIDNARLYEQAKRATTARDNLMASVSHDLRNALGAIKLASVQRPIPGGKERRESGKRLGIIQRGTDRMQHLIDDLLEAANIEAGRFSVQPRRTASAALVMTSVQDLRPSAEASSLTLASDLPAALPDVSADTRRIEQVLGNLVGNAIKATRAGGAITIGAQPSKNSVRFAVVDTGTGIPAEHLPHLFDRFWQASRDKQIGNGLGLYIVKGIVEAHGGRIWATSIVGQGTSFFFSLPRASR